jgi:hypothetical protein
MLKKKKNKGEPVKPNYTKNHMTVCVSALTDNPTFASKTKEDLDDAATIVRGQSGRVAVSPMQWIVTKCPPVFRSSAFPKIDVMDG